jgi:superfamily II DNA or RNA helicase
MINKYINHFSDVLLKGGAIDEIQDNLHQKYKGLSQDELLKLLLQKDDQLKQKDELIEHYETESDNSSSNSKRKPRIMKDIEKYDIFNFHKFLRTEDGKILSSTPELYQYTPNLTAFDKNLKANSNYYRDYQKRFIEDWSLSVQELVILYYGVGSGKTMIAVNCAEQFTEITPNSFVYFLTPASLVLGTIKEMYDRGIDPTRKNEKGEYIYNFLSYQQLLGSTLNFKQNSLLIIDEAHNLRNFASKPLFEKETARKYKATGNYSLVGNKVSQALLTSDISFVRTIMMTGTLLVNSSKDLEALMSIGYKKMPLLNVEETNYNIMMNDEKTFKIYYEGLLSFYRIAQDYPTMPKKNYIIQPIKDPSLYMLSGKEAMYEDPYYMNTRNQSLKQKVDFIINLILKKPDEKFLIYSQFLSVLEGKQQYDEVEDEQGNKKVIKVSRDESSRVLKDALNKNNIPFLVITGELSAVQKLNLVKKYNENVVKVLLFTLSIKEGISFKETNNIIIIQPYWNYAIMEQVLARGIRLNSHKLGQKSTVNLYFLIGVKDNSNENIKWIADAEQVMNNDIKKLIFEWKQSTNNTDIKQKNYGPFAVNNGSRDIDLFNRMIRKQEEINEFELKLLSLPRFETVNNVENNEFVAEYKNTLYKLEEQNINLTNKEQIELKKKMYKEFYTKNLEKVSSTITRFLSDSRYRSNRNPDLEDKMEEYKSSDNTEKLKNLIKKNASLEELFKAFNIDKKEIVAFQANFTPADKCDELVRISGINNDTKPIIRILEPTAGIGNVISSLMKANNKANYLVDCNEYHNIFYQIGKSIYSDIDNVKWMNSDFYVYQNKYNYDYILGNPPFNLPYVALVPQEILPPKKDPNEKIDPSTQKIVKYQTILVKKDLHLYDVDFVAKAYNMLSDGGVLTFIISDRFQRQPDIRPFKPFNLYIDAMKKKDPKSVEIVKSKEFKKDKGVVKEQETSYGMVIIKLIKLDGFIIDLQNEKLINNMINNLDELTEEQKKEMMVSKSKTNLKTRAKRLKQPKILL